MNRCVLIIGAGSDIAKEIAKIYLENKNYLYLITRNKKILENYNGGLFKNQNVKIIEFNQNDDIFNLRFLSENNLFPETVYIANGYIGENEFFSLTEAKKIIEINYILPIHFSEKIINYFKKRNISGKLAVFTSVAGLRGRSKNYLYGSAKAALITYLSGLRQKNYKNNISITTIILGFVNTKMLEKEKKINNFLVSNPINVAKNIVKKVENKKEIYFPLKWKIIMFIIKLIPEKVFKALNF